MSQGASWSAKMIQERVFEPVNGYIAPMDCGRSASCPLNPTEIRVDNTGVPTDQAYLNLCRRIRELEAELALERRARQENRSPIALGIESDADSPNP